MTIMRIIRVSSFITLLVIGLAGADWPAAVQAMHAGSVRPQEKSKERPQEKPHEQLQEKPKQFAGLIKATRPESRTGGPGPEEMALFRQHVEYLRKLADQGVLIFGGHTLNHDESAFGIVIVRADSQAAASAIIEADALVRARLVTVTVFPFEGLLGCTSSASGQTSSAPAIDESNTGTKDTTAASNHQKQP